MPHARRGWRTTGLGRVHRAGCRVGCRYGRPCPGTGHPRRLRPGSPRLPGVPGVTRDPPPRAMPTASSVLGFLDSLTGTWATSSLFWVVSNFRPFLKFTGRSDLVDAVGLAGVKRSHAIVPVLSDDVQRRVVQACASAVIAARDAAITLLAVTTGLRACDIVNLRLADIDWRARTASLVQQKTNNPLTVPLTDLLIGRLADYVLDQRPDSPDEHVFLRSVAPHRRLADHATIHRVIATVFAQGRRDRREGRHSPAAPQRRNQAAARVGPAADDLGRAGPRQPGIDRPVPERRPGPSARVRAGRPRRDRGHERPPASPARSRRSWRPTSRSRRRWASTAPPGSGT